MMPIEMAGDAPLNDDEPIAILCQPMKSLENDVRVQGAIVGSCSKCRREVWIAKSSVSVLEEHETARAYCIACGLKMAWDEGEISAHMAPKAAEELRGLLSDDEVEHLLRHFKSL